MTKTQKKYSTKNKSQPMLIIYGKTSTETKSDQELSYLTLL